MGRLYGDDATNFCGFSAPWYVACFAEGEIVVAATVRFSDIIDRLFSFFPYEFQQDFFDVSDRGVSSYEWYVEVNSKVAAQ